MRRGELFAFMAAGSPLNMAARASEGVAPPPDGAPDLRNWQRIYRFDEGCLRDIGVSSAHAVDGVSHYLIFDVGVDAVDDELGGDRVSGCVCSCIGTPRGSPVLELRTTIHLLSTLTSDRSSVNNSIGRRPV